jgi:hypothetical protein
MSAQKVRERTGDDETDEILAEMEAEGLELPAFSGDGDDSGDESKTKDREDDDDAEGDSNKDQKGDKDDDQSGDEDDESKSEKDGDDEGDDHTDDDEGEGEGDDDDESDDDENGKKKGKLSLVQKYRKTKKLLADARTTIDQLQNAKSEEQFEKELADFAKAQGWEIGPAKQFVELVAKKAGLPKDMMDDIQKSREERRTVEYWKTQRKQFDKDFAGNVTPILEDLGKSKAEITAIRETLMTDESSEFWAWDKKNKPKTLVQLALGVVRGSGTRTSSERSGNRTTRTPRGKDVSDMTADDINEMSDEDFDKFSDNLGKTQKSQIHRS